MQLRRRVAATAGARPWSSVPGALRLVAAAALAAQLAVHWVQPLPRARAIDLPDAPAPATMQLAALGDSIPLAQAATLYLQAFDNQPGVSIPFADLDYERLERWLALLLTIDPAGQYPLLLASHVYAQVPDASRQRLMLEFVRRSFDADPDRRWRWLAHAAIIARHRLHDTALALRYARAISAQATGADVPGWARQMSILLLADTGEIEAARILLGGLLASGGVTDPQEARFLLERLGQAADDAGARAGQVPGSVP
jgi:hypothetical protein